MDSYESHEVDIKQTLRVLWRHKLIILLSVAVVAGGILFLSLRQLPLYSASATVVIRPVVAPLSVGGNSSGKAGPLGLELSPESEAEILKSATIATRVTRSLGLATPVEDLLERVDVDIVTDEVLKVTASSPSRKQAAALADAFASEYVGHRRDLATERLADVAADLRQRLDSISARVSELDAEIVAKAADPSKKPEVNRLTAERDGLIYQVGTLRTRYEDVRSTESSNGGGDVVQTALIPRSPSSPKPIRDGAVGLFLGGLLGIGGALLRERLDDRIRTGSDAARVAGLPVIATLPRVDRPGDVMASFENPNSPAAEAHRALRQSLAAMGLGKGLRTILITSEDVAAGKSTIAANLSAACALAGLRTIVVSGDMRRPTLHRYFDAPNTNGLSTALGSTRPVKGLLVRTELPTLRVLPSGPMPQRPAELLDGARLGELIEELRAEADVVIFDSPPVAAGADALVFAAHSDLTIVVVRHEVAKAAGTQATVAAVGRAGARNTAMVLNAAEKDSAGGYYGYYTSYYTENVIEAAPAPVLPPVSNGNGNGSRRPGRPATVEPLSEEISTLTEPDASAIAASSPGEPEAMHGESEPVEVLETVSFEAAVPQDIIPSNGKSSGNGNGSRRPRKPATVPVSGISTPTEPEASATAALAGEPEAMQGESEPVEVLETVSFEAAVPRDIIPEAAQKPRSRTKKVDGSRSRRPAGGAAGSEAASLALVSPNGNEDDVDSVVGGHAGRDGMRVSG